MKFEKPWKDKFLFLLVLKFSLDDSILETKKSDDYGEELQILFNETVDLRSKFVQSFKKFKIFLIDDKI